MVYNFFCEFVATGCDASKNNWSCCTASNPCAIGEGDCDNDSQCAGDLVCGTDNCQSFNSAWPASSWDCCTSGKKSYNFRDLLKALVQCDAGKKIH